jgi:hypothetical protein
MHQGTDAGTLACNEKVQRYRLLAGVPDHFKVLLQAAF